ncbi:kelch repeat protein [Ostertagia ostertagi]
MLSKRCRLGATTLNGKIYVCGGYDGAQFLNSVECFDPVTMRWSPVTPMNIKRSRVSLVSNANSIYAIAGYDGMSNLSSMEVYREETDQWELSTPLGSHEGGVGVGVIPIPPNMLAG